MSAAAPPARAQLELAFGFRFADLYDSGGLARLDHCFVDWLRARDAELASQLLAARAVPPPDTRDQAPLLLAVAPHTEAFVAELFGIADEVSDLTARHEALGPLLRVKWKFVKRQALLGVAPEALVDFDPAAAEATISGWLDGPFGELAFATAIDRWQGAERDGDEAAQAQAKERLALALLYCAWAAGTPAGQERHRHGVLFRQPEKTDAYALLPQVRERELRGIAVRAIAPGHERRRRGFALTDPGTDLAGALDQAKYCLLCHDRKKDSCSKGLPEKAPAKGEVQVLRQFKKTVFGVELAGCPLEERISEFHTLKLQGCAIGALAMITIENPLVAATGHRICNDCMKACIYQQQTPVDIPQAETRTLKDVLELPWGFEIYALLTRWNPLNLQRPVPLRSTGRKVLVAGTGPAGFTLSHHLINDGHAVVAVDGLKIEPLDPRLSGVHADGSRCAFGPVEDVETLFEKLDERVMAGFGGVAEYGITVRWNKNFLKIVRLLLERRAEFALYGGIRFGGTLGVEESFAAGFDHVALALGAGRPTILTIPNGLARGVRTASDFLMALQLTGAAKADSLANMQLRLPVVVIGGGLSAIDAATEALAYYPVQVEKFLLRYEMLSHELDEATIRAGWSDEDRGVADEFIAHAAAIRRERQRASIEAREPAIMKLLALWGGVTIAYRKRMIDSPAYTLNHEEIEKALEEGVLLAECLNPDRIEIDANGAVRAIRLRRATRDDAGRWHDGEAVEMPARAVLIAAGTHPNTVLAREDQVHFALDGRYFQAIDEHGEPVRPERNHSKPQAVQVLLSQIADGRMISFFGDLHPSYAGNVVKAMGSARQGYPTVSRVLARRAPQDARPFPDFVRQLDDALRARIERVERLGPQIVEIVVRAPQAARRFEPGQFYRLQNYETRAHSVRVDGITTRLATEGLALTGAWVDRDAGLISTIVLEMGGSSDLCALLEPGEPVVLMGPTGEPTEIRGDETVVLLGGGLGNAVLFSIGAAFRAAGSKVLYFAGYRTPADRFKVADIERAGDVIVWCSDVGPAIEPGRAGDRSFVGNIIEAMIAYGEGKLGEPVLRLQDADRLITIGSDRMMAAVALERSGRLAHLLKPGHIGIGSINSPMQCMMKEICAQCLQPHRDPETGEVRYVFSCFNQDQPLDRVDFAALNQRLRQNSLAEKLTARWLDLCLRHLPEDAHRI